MSSSAKDKRWAIVPPSSETSDAVSESLRLGAEEESPATLRSEPGKRRPASRAPHSGERLKSDAPFGGTTGTFRRDRLKGEGRAEKTGSEGRSDKDGAEAKSTLATETLAPPTLRDHSLLEEPTPVAGAPDVGGARGVGGATTRGDSAARGDSATRDRAAGRSSIPARGARFDTQISQYSRKRGFPEREEALGAPAREQPLRGDSSQEDVETIPAPPWLDELDEPGIGVSAPPPAATTTAAPSEAAGTRSGRTRPSKKRDGKKTS